MTDLQQPLPPHSPGKIFVFSAASGAGKTTLLDYLKRSVPNLVYSISATTRSPRMSEKDGVHYFFLSESEFKRRIASSEFAEWAVVHGHYYGTPRRFVDEVTVSGQHIIMDIDVFGKKKFDIVYPQSVGILLLPPSMDVLRERLLRRNTDSLSVIDLRIANAVKEMEFAKKEGKYEYTVVNDDLERAKFEVVGIVRNVIAAR
jgi:guanylate kinase